MRRILTWGLIAAALPLLAGCAAASGSPEQRIADGLRQAGLTVTQVKAGEWKDGFTSNLDVDIVVADAELPEETAKQLLVVVARSIDAPGYEIVSVAVGYDPVGEVRRTDIVQLDLTAAAADLGLRTSGEDLGGSIRLSGSELAKAEEG